MVDKRKKNDKMTKTIKAVKPTKITATTKKKPIKASARSKTDAKIDKSKRTDKRTDTKTNKNKTKTPVKTKIKSKTSPVKKSTTIPMTKPIFPSQATKSTRPKPVFSSGSTTPSSTGSPLSFVPYQAQKNEEYMNSKQEQHFLAILQQWKQTLMQEVDRTVDDMRNAANPADLNDRASQEEEIAKELRARDRERKLIRKIEEALERLELHEYGYCEECGVEIGIKRLEARPTATLCIDCKTLDEIRERQIGSSSSGMYE